ncbi:DMT family transporter [Novosphingobium mangrovi (ex Huang et al. 2023)]|uniref:DMT family transporter n=1 Tax=Novosphingobium mangrovi (ex Huang et al. 2023) TaxID=2976432 RepID=A0ABT2I3P6_9SPHN|nr:DMT family transporter [Novosphingobium mangrovi (ex Huang et al. 2023)]MCT2399429.1 DMT family transporter [Novosphingobium mangrovi (ex Huang et al. 2023)]
MTAQTRSSQDRPLLAISLRIAAMVMLSTMFMLIKVASERGVSVPELIFWRQALSVPLIFAWLVATGNVGLLATRRMGSHAMRATTGTAGLCCNVGAATLLPLPEATTLGFTSPLFAVVITALVLRDKVGVWRWTAVALGFAGVLIIAQPGSEPVAPLGIASGLGAGIIVATVSFQIRDLARTDAPISCVFWFAFYGTLLTAVLLPIYARPHGMTEWIVLGAIALTGTLAQFLITAALRYGQVASVVVMDYSSLIWATLYGWLIWDSFPPSTTAFGAPLIIAAGLIITWRERYLSRRISPTSAMDVSAMEEMACDTPAETPGEPAPRP